MTYKEVIREFNEACKTWQLSDGYLTDNRYATRADIPCIANEMRYGIVYLRDDAVELLITRIEELEKQKGAM